MTSSWPGLNESKPKISFRTLRGTKVNIRPDLYFHKEEIPGPPDQSDLQWYPPAANRASASERKQQAVLLKCGQAPDMARAEMLSGFYPLAPIGGEPWNGLEALYLAAGTVAAVLRLLLGLAHFGGVEEFVECASQLQGSRAVGELEPEGRRRQHGQDAEKEERTLHPGENEQCGQCRPEDAGEREVLTPLVGEVGRQVSLASLFGQTLDPQFDQPGLEQGPVS